jgi:hypothetical protein
MHKGLEHFEASELQARGTQKPGACPRQTDLACHEIPRPGPNSRIINGAAEFAFALSSEADPVCSRG